MLDALRSRATIYIAGLAPGTRTTLNVRRAKTICAHASHLHHHHSKLTAIAGIGASAPR
jgi:hypothetical protein